MPPKRKSTAPEPAGPASETKKSKSGLNVGDQFPDLGPLQNDEEKLTDLTEVLKTKGIILFFYPRANTPGCTTQACGLSDAYSQISAAGYELFGMSADKPKSQATWKAKHKFPYHLLCDPSFEALKKLGVAKGEKSVNRSHLIVEKGGKLLAVEYGISPKDSIAKAKGFVSSGTVASSTGTSDKVVGVKLDVNKKSGHVSVKMSKAV